MPTYSYIILLALAVTVLLMVPNIFVKKRYKNYANQMKEIVWTHNYEKVDKEDIRSAMVRIDKELNTTGVREQTYNAFVEKFSEALIKDLSESSLSKNAKIKKLNKAIDLLTMNFSVDGLELLQNAKDKLEGNVEL